MADLTVKPMNDAAFQLENASTRLRLAQTRTPAGSESASRQDLESASQQFESLLLNFMIREMRATVPDSGLFAKSMAESVFNAMLDEKYGDLMAAGGGIGLSRMIVEQMGRSRAQPVDDEPRPEIPDKLK